MYFPLCSSFSLLFELARCHLHDVFKYLGYFNVNCTQLFETSLKIHNPFLQISKCLSNVCHILIIPFLFYFEYKLLSCVYIRLEFLSPH